MEITGRQIFLREIKFLALAGVLSVVQTWFNCTRCHTDAAAYARVTFLCFCLWVLLWRGNSIITDIINKRVSWLTDPIRRLLIGLAAAIIYTISIVLLIMYTFQWVFGFKLGGNVQYTLIYSVIITLIVCVLLHSREFFLNWRKLELDTAQLRNESLTSRYESLKNQMDPHFLFNSLNVLTNLVYQDPDRSAAFIKQLAEVYRYVLDTRHNELVALDEERKFVNAYLYLNRIRFGEKLIINDELNGASGWIPPLAVQMLVENAIKHNVISEEDPLHIRLFVDNGYVVVENNLQRRQQIEGATSGIGLENISKRYEMISQQKIQVEETLHTFRVRLPLIEKPDERIDH